MFLDVGSGPNYETSDRYVYGEPPFLLDFCVKPPCNTNAANIAANPEIADCYKWPERFHLIPAGGSLTKQGGILDGTDIDGNPFPISVDDAHVRWEICRGCGDRFFE